MFARKLALLLGEPGRARSQLSSSSTVIAAIGRLPKYRENAASRNFKFRRTYANELLSLVHLRTLATQDDHFRCGFSCVITVLLFLHLSKENASVLSLHCSTALHTFVKIYNRDREQTVKNLSS